MPRQNRVTPFGTLIATPARGTLTGNRGVLHDAQGRLTGRRWTTQAWIACLLAFKGRQRQIMAPGRWTELFFLDEATALSAGHRPCGECRRADYRRFREAWSTGNPEAGVSSRDRVGAVDALLHAERTAAPRAAGYGPVTAPGSLPDGAFVLLGAGDAARPCLWWAGRLWPWAPEGYGPPGGWPRGAAPHLLTPPSIARALAAGYEPTVHISAGG